ncbi:MAG: response regulator transcription factor [Gemmatimonadaceae bacterium]
MRLLFAEDDRQLRESVTRGLRETSYVVDQAADGSEALALFGENDYDAVILDVLMPNTDGLAVCRAIRAAESAVPILMLTALDEVEQRITGLDAGADDYLTKPFDFGELLARLRALMRRRGEILATDLTVGDLVIDTRTRLTRRGTREISLTTKEFAFLHYLARQAGRVVPRAELMAHVWDDRTGSYSNIIDVYASRLRRKVDEGDETPMFTTLRGVGYMLTIPGAAGKPGEMSASAPHEKPASPRPE